MRKPSDIPNEVGYKLLAIIRDKGSSVTYVIKTYVEFRNGRHCLHAVPDGQLDTVVGWTELSHPTESGPQ